MPHDLVLNNQHIHDIPFIALGPKVAVVRRVDELCCNPNAVAASQHRTFDDMSHVELSRDLGYRPIHILVSHRRGERDHTNAVLFGQTGNQRVGHAVAEIILIGFAREVA